MSRAYSRDNSCALCGLSKTLGSLNSGFDLGKALAEFFNVRAQIHFDLRLRFTANGAAASIVIVNLTAAKNNRPQLRKSGVRAALVGKQLGLFLFLRGVLGLGGLRLGGALLEFVHAAGGVHELLLAGVERMADVANADDDGRAWWSAS